jgi:hypothetical protein
VDADAPHVRRSCLAARDLRARAVRAPHLVGRSLGSVVAYDTLNGLLNEDVSRSTRTQLLLTFGSPLDKTAFLFRAQSEFSDVREALAAATQPLIVDYALRPR